MANMIDQIQKMQAISQSVTQTKLMRSKLNLQRDISESATGAMEGAGVSTDEDGNEVETPGKFNRTKFLTNLKEKGRIFEAEEFEKKFLETDATKLEAEALQIFTYSDRLRQGLQTFQAGDKKEAINILNKGKPKAHHIVDVRPLQHNKMQVTLTGGKKQTIDVNKLNEALTDAKTQYLQRMAIIRQKQASDGTIKSLNAHKAIIFSKIIDNEHTGRDTFSNLSKSEIELIQPELDLIDTKELSKTPGVALQFLKKDSGQAIVNLLGSIRQARKIQSGSREAKMAGYDYIVGKEYTTKEGETVVFEGMKDGKPHFKKVTKK